MAKQDTKLTPKVPVNSGAAISLKDEGVPLLCDIVTRLTDKSANVGDAARTTLHVCTLMGWRDAAQWISQELNGYAPNAPAPRHRHVVARVRWRPYGLEALASQVEWEVMRGATKGRPIPWVIRSSLDEVMRNAAGPDVAVHASDEEERLSESDGRKVRGHDETIIESTQYQQCLESLRNQLFSWASQSYSASRVGDLAGDTWSSFRRVVDEALVKLDMGDHLTAIETGLTSSNSQDWRLAMYGVRDVIRDLGNQLWLVADETYPYLDNDNGKPIRVTELEYVNRLWAYLHQKGVTGRTGKYLRAELRRIHALDDFANKAHKGVTQDELRLAVIGIYTVLGELVTRTDLQPVTEVVAPDKETGDA